MTYRYCTVCGNKITNNDLTQHDATCQFYPTGTPLPQK